LLQNLAACADAGVTLIEQPLPEKADAALAHIKRPIPVCADESLHDREGLEALAGKYDAINVKLDKAGGLTEALALAAEAEQRGFFIMVGCMVATSLAMAPAMLVAQRARVVDLDGPLLLARDRANGLRYDGSLAYPARCGVVGLKGRHIPLYACTTAAEPRSGGPHGHQAKRSHFTCRCWLRFGVADNRSRPRQVSQ
jgi:L-alanine-DL-glutamate epimerase-like enolase superfamily enzyme